MSTVKTRMPMELAAALWVLGLLTGGEMAEAAAGALATGGKGEALGRLATQTVDRDDEETLWIAAMAEAGVVAPEPPQALLLVAKFYAAQVTAGTMEAHLCAKMLWRLQLAVMQFPEELLRFIALATAWEEAGPGEKRAAVEKKIVDGCMGLLGKKAFAREGSAE